MKIKYSHKKIFSIVILGLLVFSSSAQAAVPTYDVGLNPFFRALEEEKKMKIDLRSTVLDVATNLFLDEIGGGQLYVDDYYNYLFDVKPEQQKATDDFYKRYEKAPNAAAMKQGTEKMIYENNGNAYTLGEVPGFSGKPKDIFDPSNSEKTGRNPYSLFVEYTSPDNNSYGIKTKALSTIMEEGGKATQVRKAESSEGYLPKKVGAKDGVGGTIVTPAQNTRDASSMAFKKQFDRVNEQKCPEILSLYTTQVSKIMYEQGMYGKGRSRIGNMAKNYAEGKAAAALCNLLGLT